jgi:integrase
LSEARYWDTELRGFGIIVRPKTASFVFQRDLHGKSVKVTIGRVGTWTVAMARARAREVAVDMDRGINPNVTKRQAKARGITVKQALELHGQDMRKRGCVPLSIEVVEKEVPKYLPDWMSRPLVDLSKLDCVQRHAKLSVERGPMIANKILKILGAAFRGAARVYEHLSEVPPTKAIRWNHSPRRRSPIAWNDLPAWWDRVHALRNPIRRDLQLLLLFTGLRSTDAKTIRWEHVDMVRKTLHRPKPKGGVDRAFTIPLSELVLGLLRRRRRENDVLFPGSGWVFPTRVRGGVVSHVAEVKELRGIVTAKGTESKVGVLPSPHRLRDTFLTAAHECDVRELNIKTLANHALPGGDVTDGYIRPDVEHLRACVEKVASFLLGKAGQQGYADEAVTRS